LSYTWGSGSTDSSLLITSEQILSVELEYQSGCSLYDSLHITYREPIEVTYEVIPSPDSGPHGSIIVLPANGTPPYTIEWNDGFLSGDTIAATWPGTYLLTITDANGCSIIDTVVVPWGTIIQQTMDNIIVYPNPFTDELRIHSNVLVEMVKVYTLSGQIKWQNNSTSIDQVIATSTWPAGIYLIEVRTASFNGHMWVEKL
jgi:hypothetical protein